MRIGRARLQGQSDVDNVLNAGTILSENGTFGPTWLRPTVILGGQNFTNAEIAPSLGRNLSAGANGTVNTLLTIPFTDFENRISQLDLRFSKNLRLGRARLQGQFDLYNVLNASTILSENATYGSTWLQPRAILGGRLLKFGAQIDF